jgi:hypothetical protein
VSPVNYELGVYIRGDDILHSHRRENLKSYTELLLYRHCICVLPCSIPNGVNLHLDFLNVNKFS